MATHMREIVPKLQLSSIEDARAKFELKEEDESGDSEGEEDIYDCARSVSQESISFHAVDKVSMILQRDFRGFSP